MVYAAFDLALMKRAVVIEDEVYSRELLCTLLSDYCAGIEVVGSAGSAEEGRALIERVEPDVVFLDVEMPRGDGLALTDAFPEADFHFVFVTGYRKGRIPDLEKRALAWLRKPVDLLELRALLAGLGLAQEAAGMGEEEGQLEGVELGELLYIEGNRRYALLLLADGQSKVGERRLQEYEGKLAGRGYFRIHRNYLVRLDAVVAYEAGRAGQLTLRNGKALPLAARRKRAFVQALKTRRQGNGG